MALIKCPECDKEISDKALQCIHCGYPINTTESKDIHTNPTLDINHSMALENNFSKDKKEHIKEDLNNQEKKEALLKKLEKQKQEDTKLKGYAVIWSIIWTLICIWLFSMSEHGSLGILVALSFFFAIGGWGMLAISISSLERIEKDIKTASKSLEEYKKMVNERIERINAQAEAEEAIKHPKCPMCGSTNTQIISTLNRAASVGMVGLASSKIGKQYECKNCKHKW